MPSTWTGAMANRGDEANGTTDSMGYVEDPSGERIFIARHQPADAGSRMAVPCAASVRAKLAPRR